MSGFEENWLFVKKKVAPAIEREFGTSMLFLRQQGGSLLARSAVIPIVLTFEQYGLSLAQCETQGCQSKLHLFVLICTSPACFPLKTCF